MKLFPTFALAACVALLAALALARPVSPPEVLGSLSVPLQGSVLPKPFQVAKLDPQWVPVPVPGGFVQVPSRLPAGVIVQMPLEVYGEFNLSNPSEETSTRVIDYSGSGYELWMPFERRQWRRDNDGAPFAPGADPFDNDQPLASVFQYSHGLWNGYGDFHSTALGPESFKTLQPGDEEEVSDTGANFAVLLIDDPAVLRSMLLWPDSLSSTQTWHYQRTFVYRTFMPLDSPEYLPYIPMDFASGTGNKSITIQALWQ